MGWPSKLFANTISSFTGMISVFLLISGNVKICCTKQIFQVNAG
jgi:hypothetical protein